MLQAEIHQLEHGPGIRLAGTLRESQPAHERVEGDSCRQQRHQHPAQAELFGHRDEASTRRQQHQLLNTLARGNREVEGEPRAVRHAHESDAVEV